MVKKTQGETKHDTLRSPLYMILKNCSKSGGIMKCLDNCLKIKDATSDDNPDWNIDFGFLTRCHQMYKEKESNGKTEYKTMTRNELADHSLLLKMQKYDDDTNDAVNLGARNFLDHPVTKMYIRKRWAEAKWIFYFVIMFMHFVYASTFTVYATLVYHDICPLSQDENYYSTENVNLFEPSTWVFWNEIDCTYLTRNVTNNSTGEVDWQFTNHANVAIVAWICLIIFTVIVCIRELFDFIDQKWQNFLEIDTNIHIFMVVMVGTCLWHSNPFDGEMKVRKFQHHAAVWGMFATWLQMSLYMERLPGYGIYLLMLRKVAKTFIKLFWAYLSLLAAFGFTFYLVFPSQYYFQNDIPSVFVKVSKHAIIFYI